MPAYTIRLPEELRKAIRIAAAKKDKSMNQWIVDVLKEKIEQEEDSNERK